MFIAVKCVECSLFQTQQQRKDKKFICKVCGTKQSVKKVYAISEKNKDIRLMIQKLNMESQSQEVNSCSHDSFGFSQSSNRSPNSNDIKLNPIVEKTASKWEMYLPQPDSGSDVENGQMYGNDFQFTLEAPKKSSRDFKGRKNVQKSKTSDITSSFRHRESQNKDETNLPKRMNQSSNQPILSKSIEDLSTKSSVSRKRLPSPNTHKPATEKASKWSKFLEKAESESDMDSE